MDNEIKEAKGLGFKLLSRLYQNYLKKAIDGKGRDANRMKHNTLNLKRRHTVLPGTLF